MVCTVSSVAWNRCTNNKFRAISWRLVARLHEIPTPAFSWRRWLGFNVSFLDRFTPLETSCPHSSNRTVYVPLSQTSVTLVWRTVRQWCRDGKVAVGLHDTGRASDTISGALSCQLLVSACIIDFNEWQFHNMRYRDIGLVTSVWSRVRMVDGRGSADGRTPAVAEAAADCKTRCD